MDDLAQILAIYNHEILTGTANWNDQGVALEQYPTTFSRHATAAISNDCG